MSKSKPHTHDAAVLKAGEWLQRIRRCDVVLLEPVVANRRVSECPDGYGIAPDGSHVVECKVSITDFVRDKHKPFRQVPSEGMGRWRWYMTPAGLIDAPCFDRNAPDGWGWVEYGKGRCGFRILRRAEPFDAVSFAEPLMLRMRLTENVRSRRQQAA